MADKKNDLQKQLDDALAVIAEQNAMIEELSGANALAKSVVVTHEGKQYEVLGGFVHNGIRVSPDALRERTDLIEMLIHIDSELLKKL